MGWCSRNDGSERHVLASGRIARDAAIYPFQLCKAILEGLRDELVEQGRYSKPLALWAPSGLVYLGPVEEDALERMLVESLLKLQKHDGLPDIVDSASGQVLKGHLVGKARQEEMEYFFGMNVCTKVPEGEAWDRTGKRPIGVRWVDVNKGDDDDPNYRSRLVAKDIRKKGEDAIFAPTPPLESLRAVLSLVASPQVWMN